MSQIEIETGLVAGSDGPGDEGSSRRKMGTVAFLVRRVVAAFVSFLVTLVIGFVIFSLIPSDPIRAITHGHATSPAQIAELRRSLGLDQPIVLRFFTFVWNTLHGNLGYSAQYRQSVGSLIAERFWPTVLLMGVSTLIAVALGLWLGTRSGWKPGSKFDRFWSGTSLVLWSVPTFWLGLLLLILLATGIGPIPSLFPAGGMTNPAAPQSGIGHFLDVVHHLALPCATLVLVSFAQNLTIMRASVADELGSPYLLTAKAKGLRDSDVLLKHAVPNALLPTVTVTFLQLGSLIGGAITVETVFSWPGLGYLAYQAIQIPDLSLLQGTFVVFSATVIFFNLIADLLYRVLDPRVRD